VNGGGLDQFTIRNIAAGWVFTLPAAALLSGVLCFLIRHLA
jgi:PiT family inorganic phosphate transporter